MSYHNRIAEKSKAIVRRKRSISIEWRIAENDREWAQLRQPSTPAVQTPRDLRRWVGEVLLLIFILGGIGGWQWYATQAEWQQHEPRCDDLERGQCHGEDYEDDGEGS